MTKPMTELTFQAVGDFYPNIVNDLDTPEKLSEYLGISLSAAKALEKVSRVVYLTIHGKDDDHISLEDRRDFERALGHIITEGVTLNKPE